MSLTSRKVASLVGAATLGAVVITGAASAAGSSAGASVMTPNFSKLSSSQVKARSAGGQERVVVVFNNQLANLPANRAHRQARQAAAAAMQAPLVTQLKQVGATDMTRLSLLNAVAATMPAAEAGALANTPGVKAVVPDGTIIIGDARSTTPTVAASRVGKSTMPGNCGQRPAVVQCIPQQATAGARSPDQHPRRIGQPERARRSLLDRDGSRCHRRERQRRHAGREPQPDPAQRGARDHRRPGPEPRTSSTTNSTETSPRSPPRARSPTHTRLSFPSRTSPRTAPSASRVTPPAPPFSPPVSSQTRTRRARSWLPSRRSSRACSRP